MRARLLLAPVMLVAAALATGSVSPSQPEFTSDFGFRAEQILVPHGDNPYVSLVPGRFLRLEGEEDGALVEVEITVLDRVRPLFFQVNGTWLTAAARVVEEREWIDGELADVTWQYLATCRRTGNVYALGEDVDRYEDGELVGHDGSWLVGVDGAQPGLHMPGHFLLGARYLRTLAPGVSTDRAENVRMGVEVGTPAGLFDGGVVILESSEEEDEEVILVYAAGVGLVADGPLRLVEHR